MAWMVYSCICHSVNTHVWTDIDTDIHTFWHRKTPVPPVLAQVQGSIWQTSKWRPWVKTKWRWVKHHWSSIWWEEKHPATPAILMVPRFDLNSKFRIYKTSWYCSCGLQPPTSWTWIDPGFRFLFVVPSAWTLFEVTDLQQGLPRSKIIGASSWSQWQLWTSGQGDHLFSCTRL